MTMVTVFCAIFVADFFVLDFQRNITENILPACIFTRIYHTAILRACVKNIREIQRFLPKRLILSEVNPNNCPQGD